MGKNKKVSCFTDLYFCYIFSYVYNIIQGCHTLEEFKNNKKIQGNSGNFFTSDKF